MAAHKTMPTNVIISHLVSRARPIFGANQATLSGKKRAISIDDDLLASAPVPAKRQSAATKRKAALARVVSKNNRRRRHGM